MKISKIIVVLLVLCMAIACLTGCGGTSVEGVEESTPNASEETEQSADAEGVSAIEVDKGLLNVEITVPAGMVGENPEETMANLEEDGRKDVTLNDDGSVSFKMSKSEHKEMMQELYDEYSAEFDAIADSGDFESISKVEYNDGFTKFDVYVDQGKYESSFLEGFVTLQLGITGRLYNVFNGTADDKIVVNVVNEETEEVFHTATYPDDLEG